MKTATEYLWFNTKAKRELVRITDQVANIARQSRVQEGMAMVSAMHITAGVFVNDDEPGLWSDIWKWRSPRESSSSERGSRFSTPSSTVNAGKG